MGLGVVGFDASGRRSGLEIEVSTDFDPGGGFDPVRLARVEVQRARRRGGRTRVSFGRLIAVEADAVIDVASNRSRDESLHRRRRCRPNVHDIDGSRGSDRRRVRCGLHGRRTSESVGGGGVDRDGSSDVHR